MEIRPVDATETRRISGNIVPAMITTTALVSALSCIELLKLIKGAPHCEYRNAFVNLALPFFAFTAPLPAEVVQGLGGTTHTLWDRTIIKEGKRNTVACGITLSELLRKVKRKTGGQISSLSYGPYLIYANFLHADDESVTEKPVLELVKEALSSGDEFGDADGIVDDRVGDSGRSPADMEELESRPYLELSAVVEDEQSGEEAEIPPIRIIRWKNGSEHR